MQNEYFFGVYSLYLVCLESHGFYLSNVHHLGQFFNQMQPSCELYIYWCILMKFKKKKNHRQTLNFKVTIGSLSYWVSLAQ
jgi:hypothetical protein